MKSLEEQMAGYSAYHQDARNKATHFVGVPIIILALFIALALLRIESVSAGMVLAALLVLYYLALDVPLGLGMLVVFGLLLWAGERIAALGTAQAGIWFAVLFVGGWALQLLGHLFEGRRPALVDNLWQIFVAPIFLCAELFFALGYKPGLRDEVRARAARMRSVA
jgi:uncharacterized membrane protein YGL010W